MSYINGSRAASSSGPSLSDLLAALQTSDLSQRQRQEIASAIRTAARALGRVPENIPADVRRLADRLKVVSPAAIGISAGRWMNVRSLLRAGLTLVQPAAPGRNRNRLSREWLVLSKRLASQSSEIGLSRLLRFLSAKGIGPNAVTEETFREFRLHLDVSLLKEPDRTFASTAKAWRRAMAEIEGWPQVTVSVPDRRRNWVSGWGRFSDSLQQDCLRWCDRLAGRDLAEDAPFRPVRPSTVARRERQVRTFATALMRMGREPTTLATLADLVDIDSFKTGLRFFLDRAGGKPTTAITDLAASLKAIARHHVRVAPDHLDKMASIIRRLASHQPRGLTETNRARLRPFDDPANVTALLVLPAKLMEQARKRRNPQQAAVQAQTAIAIEILLMAPMRLGNLVKLDIERNFVRSGRSNSLHIVIRAAEVKNRVAIEYPLPPESVALLDRYLRDFRPHLTASAGTALFPGRAGGPKVQWTLGDQISRAIRTHIGLQVHSHLFRHIAAKLYLDANPGMYEVVRRVLGHRSIDTTTVFYTGLETAAAVRHFDATILELRRENKPENGRHTLRANKSKQSK